MTKGTKQIRFGAVQRKIEGLELLLSAYKLGLKTAVKDSPDYYLYFGKIMALEVAIESLKELGE